VCKPAVDREVLGARAVFVRPDVRAGDPEAGDQDGGERRKDCEARS
jgi:hypothetical protein